MPLGFVITAGVVTLAMAVSLWPPARSGLLGLATWFVSAIVNESPFLAFCYMGISTLLALGEFHGAQVWVAVGLDTAPFVGTPVLVRRSLRAAPAIEQALDRDLGARWQTRSRQVDQTKPALGSGRVRAAASVPSGCEAHRQPQLRGRWAPQPPRSLSEPGRQQRRAGTDPSARWRLHARAGAQELLRAAAAVPARAPRLGVHQCDLPASARSQLPRRADRRQEGDRLGSRTRERVRRDPDRIVLAGSSFGARLATLAGSTANDPAFQPGFEHADTSVAAVVGLYGYYGANGSRQSLPSSPFDYADRGTALLIVHGEQDTLTSPNTARTLAERSRNASANPVVYAELPCAQHSFDLLSSIRIEP